MALRGRRATVERGTNAMPPAPSPRRPNWAARAPSCFLRPLLLRARSAFSWVWVPPIIIASAVSEERAPLAIRGPIFSTCSVCWLVRASCERGRPTPLQRACSSQRRNRAAKAVWTIWLRLARRRLRRPCRICRVAMQRTSCSRALAIPSCWRSTRMRRCRTSSRAKSCSGTSTCLAGSCRLIFLS